MVVFVRQLIESGDVVIEKFTERIGNIENSFVRWREITSFSAPILTLFLCFILPYSNLHIRRTASRVFGLRWPRALRSNRVRTEVYRMENARQLYFEALQSQWDREVERRMN